MLTLSELLERIRPTGTPGAPNEGEQQKWREGRTAELAEVTKLLAEFEDHAQDVVAAAEADAKRRREDAQRQARRIAATLPDRIAIAKVEIADRDSERRDAEELRIRSAAEQEAARLLRTADEAIPGLVDTAVQLIWDSVTPVQRQR